MERLCCFYTLYQMEELFSSIVRVKISYLYNTALSK